MASASSSADDKQCKKSGNIEDDGFGSSSESEDGGEPISPTLKYQFKQAAHKVQIETMNSTIQVDQNIMLTLYGLYKIATVGPCTEPQPGIFNMKGRAKWNAWNTNSHLTKAKAMQQYINTVITTYNWKPEEMLAGPSSSSSSKSKKYVPSSVMGGNAVSSFALPTEEESNDDTDDDDDADDIFSWVKEDKTELVESWLKGKNDPNIQDKNGLTLLHWSVDRGHTELCKMLLKYDSNPNIPDGEGDTSLDYAVTCDHSEIIEVLKKALANQSSEVP